MSEFRTANGVIFYEVVAARESASSCAEPLQTVTLLHNFMSTGRAAWGPALELLSRRYRIILPDLPGHGRSHGYPAGFDHGEIARQLAGILRKEGASAGHLVGCSSGGMIAQRMVQQGLVDPATLGLVSTTYSVDPATTGEPTSLNPNDFRASKNWLDATARLHDGRHHEGYFERELLAGFMQLTPETAIDLSLGQLAAWSMPVCLIHGADDEIFPLPIAEAMAATLPNVELHVVPQQTHALLLRKPQLVAQLLNDFLERSAEYSVPKKGE